MVSSMLLTTLLYAASAMAADNPGPWHKLMSISKHRNCVNVTEYFHKPSVPYEEIIQKGYKVSNEHPWTASEISSGMVSLFWRRVALLGTRGFVRSSVRFLTHFQIPLEKGDGPDANREVYLIFLHDPELEFHWDSEIYSNPQFQHVKTITESSTTHKDVYKVVGRPGGVFPLGITVLDVQKGKTFGMEWTLSLEFIDREPLAPQLVKLINPGVSELNFPFNEKPTKDLHELGPLNPSLPVTDFQDIMEMNSKNTEYSLRAYLKPTKELNRFVLSSSVPVIAQIYVGFDPYLVHTLVARKGLATKMDVTLTPGELYRIVFTGGLPVKDVTGFSLQAYSPEDEFVSSYVDLEVSRDQTQAPEEPKQIDDDTVAESYDDTMAES